jgi:hypothetical protein
MRNQQIAQDKGLSGEHGRLIRVDAMNGPDARKQDRLNDFVFRYRSLLFIIELLSS